ncbi:MAG: aminotransferase class V-fold PLP-dependent enzyme [Acidobacteriota bacterium]
MISLMPGPVEIDHRVQDAFRQPPLSHRSDEFIRRFEEVRATLARMTGAKHVALLNGSGTLGNEAVASCLEGPGVVLVNGEFGARIARQAARWNLPINIVEWPWGVPWDLDRVAKQLDGARWVWGVHLETSTGMVNDIQGLIALANSRGVRVALDCISSLRAVSVDLKDVWMASAVSGKAVGSFAGIAIVFAAEVPKLTRPVPVYLDVAEAMSTEGSCFTFPSPLLLALEEALRQKRDYAPLGNLVRQRLRDMGIQPLVGESAAAPVVTTFAPPEEKFHERCLRLGYRIGGESGYLAARGLVQIATMGAVIASQIDGLFDQLR